MRTRTVLTAVAMVTALAGFAGGSAWADNPFVDIAGTTHEANIDLIYNAGLTSGCTDATHYCPDNTLTRGQMATFLARSLGLGKNLPKAAQARRRSPRSATPSVERRWSSRSSSVSMAHPS